MDSEFDSSGTSADEAQHVCCCYSKLDGGEEILERNASQLKCRSRLCPYSCVTDRQKFGDRAFRKAQCQVPPTTKYTQKWAEPKSNEMVVPCIICGQSVQLLKPKDSACPKNVCVSCFEEAISCYVIAEQSPSLLGDCRLAPFEASGRNTDNLDDRFTTLSSRLECSTVFLETESSDSRQEETSKVAGVTQNARNGVGLPARAVTVNVMNQNPSASSNIGSACSSKNGEYSVSFCPNTSRSPTLVDILRLVRNMLEGENCKFEGSAVHGTTISDCNKPTKSGISESDEVNLLSPLNLEARYDASRLEAARMGPSDVDTLEHDSVPVLPVYGSKLSSDEHPHSPLHKLTQSQPSPTPLLSKTCSVSGNDSSVAKPPSKVIGSVAQQEKVASSRIDHPESFMSELPSNSEPTLATTSSKPRLSSNRGVKITRCKVVVHDAERKMAEQALSRINESLLLRQRNSPSKTKPVRTLRKDVEQPSRQRRCRALCDSDSSSYESATVTNNVRSRAIEISDDDGGDFEVVLPSESESVTCRWERPHAIQMLALRGTPLRWNQLSPPGSGSTTVTTSPVIPFQRVPNPGQSPCLDTIKTVISNISAKKMLTFSDEKIPKQ